MAIRQISVFLENRPGQLADITRILYENDINLRALNIAETADYGVLRLITNHTTLTLEKLREAGYIANISEVIGAAVPDRPGGLASLLSVIADEGIDVGYMYSILGHTGDLSYMIFRVADCERAEGVLKKHGIPVLDIKGLGIH